jgi:hypothetical protein
MKVTEITDYSIVIMKDSEDKPWLSLREIEEWFHKYPIYGFILVNLDENNLIYKLFSDEFELVVDSRVIVLLLKQKTDKVRYLAKLKVGDNVGIRVATRYYGGTTQ